MSDTVTPDPGISARGITMSGPWGRVYGPVDLDIAAGGVTVLVCPAGSACTALLLTLAGRMRPTRGMLTVFGHSPIRDIFGQAALAGIADLDTLAESITVGDLLTEQLRWESHWYRVIRRADEDDLRRVCGPVFGDLALPSLSAYVDTLTELDSLLLRMALANTRRKPLLVVGNLEQVTGDRERELLVARLVELGREQTIVTASTNGVTGQAVHQIAVANTSGAELVSQRNGV